MAVAGFILAAVLVALIRGVAWAGSAESITLSEAAALLPVEDATE
jgi:hypothetical protein